MIRLTNKNNLPEPVFRAITQNRYSGENDDNFASVTGLLKGVKQFVLEKRHYDEIIEDASDRVWSLMGSAMHSVMENSQTGNTLAEERLS